MRPQRQGRALAGHGGTGRSASCWRPGFVCLTVWGDDYVADECLDLDPGVGNPAAQAALDPLPQVIAQPGLPGRRASLASAARSITAVYPPRWRSTITASRDCADSQSAATNAFTIVSRAS